MVASVLTKDFVYCRYLEINKSFFVIERNRNQVVVEFTSVVKNAVKAVPTLLRSLKPDNHSKYKGR